MTFSEFFLLTPPNEVDKDVGRIHCSCQFSRTSRLFVNVVCGLLTQRKSFSCVVVHVPIRMATRLQTLAFANAHTFFTEILMFCTEDALLH